MRLESSIMIEKVARNAMDNNTFIVTIHDGIMVRPEDAHYFQDLILKHFEELVGYKPKVKVNIPYSTSIEGTEPHQHGTVDIAA